MGALNYREQRTENRKPKTENREEIDMLDFIEIEFKGQRREDFRNPMEFPFKIGDLAVVEVEMGEHIGVISNFGLRDKSKDPDEVHFKIIRRATPDDVKTLREINCRELEAMSICHEKVKNHGLPMKLVDSEYQFDMRKLTFYFTSEGRVDFRELVKDLAGHFKVRIDLRQIGARDETKRLGGFGVCGLQLCCTTFISCFHPVTTQMAKIQNLSLNPQKLSGTCGRLKCCLRFELGQYIEEIQKYPFKESVYKTPRGRGIVEKNDIFNGYVYLKFDDGEIDKFTLSEISKFECLKEGIPIEFDLKEGRDSESDSDDDDSSAQNDINSSQHRDDYSSRDNSYSLPFPS